MDKTSPSALQTDEPFTGYSLYPDAGDFAALDAVTGMDKAAYPGTAAVPDPAPPAQHTRPLPSPQTQPSVPAPAIQPPPAVRRRSSAAARESRSPGLFLRCVMGVLAAVGVLVYADLLLSGGQAMLTEGIGRLAAGSVFGGKDRVTVLPVLPESVPSVPIPSGTGTETTIPSMESAPPATEQSVTPPAADILTRDLSSGAENGLGIINETPYTPDLEALASADPIIDTYAALESIYGADCPAVLILHTHGTEAFQDQAEAGYHTTDTARSICTVGEALADTLRNAGIETIHCTELFDDPSFDMAYYNAAAYIRETLREYPSIRYILDIHRDAITTEDGTGIRPLSTENGTDYAQMMFVVGTDHGGSGHTEWQTNLSLAARLQAAIHEEYPTLMRDINLRSASFNAQYAPGSLLIEAGAACSTLEEAVRSIRILGETLAKEIRREP